MIYDLEEFVYHLYLSWDEDCGCYYVSILKFVSLQTMNVIC